MATKTLDAVSLCNALMDVLIETGDADLKSLGLDKGIMRLVDAPQMTQVLAHYQGRPQTVELGGSSMNTIRAVALLGKKTAFAGMIGTDPYGAKIRARMGEIGIRAHLAESTDQPTGTCVALVSADAERTLVTHLGASRLFDENLVPRDEIRDARIFHFCGYQWDTDGQKRAIAEGVELARRHGTQISFDVADPFAVGRSGDEFRKLIASGVSVVFANREEAKMLYGTPEEAARAIAGHGAIAVVKLGSEGALVRQGDQEWRVAPVKTRPVDTTAAGDMFAGGFLFGMLSGKDPRMCGRMGARLASDVISRIGAALSDEALEEVRALAR